jgi:serine/threonine protein kinase
MIFAYERRNLCGTWDHACPVLAFHAPCSLSPQQLRLRPTLAGRAIVFDGDKIHIPTHRPIRILGQGRNGFVVLCQNEFLHRPEALKVWAKLDPLDSRDKFKQGLEEARKAVAACSGNSVAQIYGAGTILERYLYATMEYVPGPTLHDYLAEQKNTDNCESIATSYLLALISTGDILHGDPHTKNVIMRKTKDDKKVQPVLVDFGTSRFTRSEKFVERHWDVVEQSIKRIFFNCDEYKRARLRVRGERLRKVNPGIHSLLLIQHTAIELIKSRDAFSK